jgi:acyl dehydratase
VTGSAQRRITTDIAGLMEMKDADLGFTEWREISQQQVDQFADATGDHQFIHVDPERAKETLFGGTIAHGFLGLALLAPVADELLHVRDAAMAINYGLDRVRFPAPLRVGARWRGGAQIADIAEIEGGAQVKMLVSIYTESGTKPVVVAESLIRFYR